MKAAFDREIREIQRQQIADLRRRETAEFMLGPKGKYFAGEDWERRADYWDGRANAAGRRLAQEMGF